MARVTQLGAEVLATATAGAARVTQLGAEVLANQPATAARVTQLGAEVLANQPATAARITQLGVEVLASSTSVEVSGDIAATTPSVVQALTGSVEVQGDITQTTPSATQKASGSEGAIGNIAQTTPSITQSATNVPNAPVHEDTQSTDYATGTSHTVTKPTGTVEGDLLILTFHVTNNSSSTNTVPTGFVPLFNGHGTANYRSSGIYWKLATDSEPTDYTVTTSTSAAAFVSISRFSNVDQICPIGPVRASSAQTTDWNTPALDIDGECIVYRAILVNDNTTITEDAEVTELATGVTSLGSDGTIGVGIDNDTYFDGDTTPSHGWTSFGNENGNGNGFLVSAAIYGTGESGAVTPVPVIESQSDLNQVVTTTVQVTPPTGIEQNDLILFLLTIADDVDFSITGFTTLAESSFGTSTDRYQIMYKIATDSEPATYTLTNVPGSQSEYVGTMLRISGVDIVSPIEDHVLDPAVSAVEDTYPSVTSSSGSLIIRGEFHDNDTSALATYIRPQSSTTVHFDDDNFGDDYGIVVTQGPGVDSGTEPERYLYTSDGGVQEVLPFTLSLRPLAPVVAGDIIQTTPSVTQEVFETSRESDASQTTPSVTSAASGQVGYFPVFESATTSGPTSGTSYVITKPSGTVEGDLLILTFTDNDLLQNLSSDVTIPSGFNVAIDDRYDSERNRFTAWKLATASEPTDYTITGTVSKVGMVSLSRFSNVDQNAPIGEVRRYTDVTANNTSDLDTPALTADGDCLIFRRGLIEAFDDSIVADSGVTEIANLNTSGISVSMIAGYDDVAYVSGTAVPAQGWTASIADGTDTATLAIYGPNQSRVTVPVPVVESQTDFEELAASSFTVDKPTGTVENDLLLIAGIDVDSETALSVSGFTTIGSGDVDGFSYYLAYKVAGASEPASYTVTANSVGSFSVGSLFRISGINTTDPIDASVFNPTVLTRTDIPSPAITTTGRALIMRGLLVDDLGPDGVGNVNDSGVQLFRDKTNSGNGNVGNMFLYAAPGPDTGIASERTFTPFSSGSTGEFNYKAFTIAIAGGVVEPTGDISQTTPSTVQTLTGEVIVEGDISQTTPPATQQANAGANVIDIITPSVVQSLTGGSDRLGDIVQTTPPITQALISEDDVVGDIGQTTSGGYTQSLIGASYSQAVVTQTTPMVSQSLTAGIDALAVAGNEFEFTQNAQFEHGRGFVSDLEFTQLVEFSTETSDALTSTVVFEQSVQATRPVPDGACPTKYYSPISTTLSDATLKGSRFRVTSSGIACPDVVPIQNTVFGYPYGSPTTTLTLSNPEFGNATVLEESTSIVRLRNGKVTVFRDPQWPSYFKHSYQFNLGCRDPSIQSILDFLKESLGQEIQITDYEGRLWKSVITNPNTPVSQQHTNLVVFGLDVEGELIAW